MFNLVDILVSDLQNKSAPEAFLLYALYDQDSNRYEVGKQLLSRNASNQHEVLAENLYISEDGYMETFVVNETSENVWFDDMIVRNTSSPIAQETHYDVWGLELSGIGFQYGGFKANKYLYNGNEILSDLNLNLYDFKSRFYDPAIGRFISIDVLADHPNQMGMSPYSAFWNNPIKYNDPNGECPDCWEFMKGVGRGIGSGAVGTWDFATSGAWKADTWKSTGNLLLGAAAMGPTGNAGNLYAVDAALGTNTVGAVSGVSAAIDNAVDKVASGDPGAIGEVVGGAAWAGVEALAGSKGVSALTKAKTAANVVSTVEDVVTVGKGAANPKVAGAINRGKQAHADFSQRAAAKGWDVTPRLTDPKTGKTVIPDAITPGGHPIELKPNTPSGRAQGARQLPKYERAMGNNGRVIYYDPKK